MCDIIIVGSENVPSHKIHLAIAKRVNDKLNLDLDSVMLGSILPDICEGRNHSVSHFQVGMKDIEGLANPDKFIVKYKNKLNNPIMIGYLIHILTDRFYNEYMFRHFYIYDDNDNGIGMFLKGKKKLLDAGTRKYLKQREFELYDRWVFINGFVPKFNSTECVDNVIDIDEAKFNKDSLKKYILSSNKDFDTINFFSKFKIYNYKITNKQDLDQIFDGCINYILDYLNNHKLIKPKK